MTCHFVGQFINVQTCVKQLRPVEVANSLKATYTYDAFERLAIRTLTNQTPSGTTHFIHMLGGGGAFDELAPGLGEQLGGLGNRKNRVCRRSRYGVGTFRSARRRDPVRILCPPSSSTVSPLTLSSVRA
jgi:hypothetical protein